MLKVLSKEGRAREDEISKAYCNGFQSGLYEMLKLTLAEQLEHRLGRLRDRALLHIWWLSLADLKALSIALLNFQKRADLTTWLRQHPPEAQLEQYFPTTTRVLPWPFPVKESK